MWILATLVRIVFQLIEALLWAVWAVIRFLARLLGLAEWQKVTTGEEYECFAAHYLERQGFRILGYTRRTGDYGVDLLAKKGMKTYAVQCKYYSSPVDGSAVQQVVAGMACYGCNAALVITNSRLTPGAWTLARRNGVEVLEGISPADSPAALTLERLLSPARLGTLALGSLGALLVWLTPALEAYRQRPVWALGLTVGSFLAAALVIWVLGRFWRKLTGNLL